MHLPVLLTGLLALTAPAPSAQAVDSLDNPFSGFETHYLANGLKVWFKRLPGAPNVSVSVALPYGSDQDPPGKEEVAHLTEHMLFTDHRGRTEQEVKEEIESRGGRRNGITHPDHTFYYVTIAREHGLFAIRWLGWLMEPHEMDPEVVDRNRRPVAVEIRARPREFFDWVFAALNPESLRPPDFWEREFGLETRNARFYDRHAALYDLEAEDLRAFYDRYYLPNAMTVTIVGDLPRDSALAVAREAFGRLPPRTLPEAYGESTDPGRFFRQATWGFRATPRYRTLFKVYEPTRPDHLRLRFIRDLLARRLGQRLRYGEEKAVYGMGVSLVQRGPVMYLAMNGSVNPGAVDFARGVVEEELEALRSGDRPAEEFEADRRALVEKLKSGFRSSEELNFLVRTSFYDRWLHDDFPDLVEVYRGMSQDDLREVAERVMVRDRRVEYVSRLQPVGPGLLLLLGLLGAAATVRLTGRALLSPVDMRRIRYVARIRTGLTLFLGLVVAYAAVGLLWLRLLGWAAERGVTLGVLQVESYGLQITAFVALGAVTLVLLVAYLSLFPRKILVFPDHVRLKYLAYRSRRIEPGDVDEIRLLRFPDIWLSSRLFPTLPLSGGVWKPAIHLKTRKGPSLFFRSRDTGELFTVLGEVLGEREVPGEEAEPEPGPAPPDAMP